MVTLKKPSPSMAMSKRLPVCLRLPVLYCRMRLWSLAPWPIWMPEGIEVLLLELVPARFTVW